jgi:hypothetical protein
MSTDPVPFVPVTRFAPSPTALLHLGHAFAALRACEAAHGAPILLRIEDLDRGRMRAEYDGARPKHRRDPMARCTRVPVARSRHSNTTGACRAAKSSRCGSATSYSRATSCQRRITWPS